MVYFDFRKQKYSILRNIIKILRNKNNQANNLWPIAYFSYGKSWPSKDYDLEKNYKSVTTNLAFAVVCK